MTHHPERHQRAALAIDQRKGFDRGKHLVDSLSTGLNLLRDRMFERIHQDVETWFGADSMSIPLSLVESSQNAKAEIDIWQVIECAEFAAEHGFLDEPAWTRSWLGELRLGNSWVNGPVQKRVAEYAELDANERGRHFARSLEQQFQEASRSPLVLYQLMPLAVRIAWAVAIGETDHAEKFRDKQAFWLPGIMDCRECDGAVLDNGDQCGECGNPVWNYRWLTAAD